MAKPEWGTKRECPSCGARYYDLQRDPIVCPRCEAVYESQPARSRARAATEDEAPTPAGAEIRVLPAEAGAGGGAVETPAQGGKAEVEGGDGESTDDDGLIEDPSELGEDDEDMAVAIEEKPEKGTE